MNDTTNANATAEFWESFRRNADALAGAGSADNPIYAEVLAKLHAVDHGLFFETCTNVAPRELIVTADGERALFPLARAVVAQAPAIPGWVIHALKPRLGFPEVARWENISVPVADLTFDPLVGTHDELGLRVYVPDLTEADAPHALQAVLRALDHGLGEEKFAESVQYTSVALRPDDIMADDPIPLLEVEEFIRWRKLTRLVKTP
jgi:hypothetical protein